MADGTIISDSGSIHAIDLNTGYTIWQWINPYSNINCSENNIIYDNYIDITIEGSCERAFDGSNMLLPNKTVNNIVIPPINDLLSPISPITRSLNIGPVTISNNMVFIPTITGEIYIHDINTGNYINKLQCPDYKLTYNNITYWNREGTRSGITIYDNKIIYYCGTYWYWPLVGSYVNPSIISSQVVVVSL